ncbi:MAG: SH3 domain-containing protein, partial [Chloroflexota bacterium]|nr:SH3 domain-containing protein [Chloroflexota bacterium]
VVYELLTWQPPFQAPEGVEHKRQLIQAHLELLPLAPSAVRPELELPSWVDDVVGWALAKSRRDRYHDVATFARMFRLGIEGEVLPESQRTSALPAAVPRTGQTTWRARRIVLRRKPRREPGDEDPTIESEEALTGPSDRPLRTAWRMGGRAARRTRPIRGALWRLMLVFALGNALLGIVLMARDGPAALVERFLSVAPGATTEVNVDRLNLRSGPGVEYDVIAVLRTGDEVDVTGLSESVDGERWWPVEVRTEAGVIQGWAWDEGLRPNEWTGRLSWIQGIVERGQRFRDGARDVLNDLRSVDPLGNVSLRRS